MIFPVSEKAPSQVPEQVPEQVRKLISVMNNDGATARELMGLVEIKHRPTFLYNYLQRALDAELIEMTIPDKPKSSRQKYRLTEKGKQIK